MRFIIKQPSATFPPAGLKSTNTIPNGTQIPNHRGSCNWCRVSKVRCRNRYLPCTQLECRFYVWVCDPWCWMCFWFCFFWKEGVIFRNWEDEPKLRKKVSFWSWKLVGLSDLVAWRSQKPLHHSSTNLRWHFWEFGKQNGYFPFKVCRNLHLQVLGPDPNLDSRPFTFWFTLLCTSIAPTFLSGLTHYGQFWNGEPAVNWMNQQLGHQNFYEMKQASMNLGFPSVFK